MMFISSKPLILVYLGLFLVLVGLLLDESLTHSVLAASLLANMVMAYIVMTMQAQIHLHQGALDWFSAHVYTKESPNPDDVKVSEDLMS